MKTGQPVASYLVRVPHAQTINWVLSVGPTSTATARGRLQAVRGP